MKRIVTCDEPLSPTVHDTPLKGSSSVSTTSWQSSIPTPQGFISSLVMSSTVSRLVMIYILFFYFLGSAAAQSAISTNMPVPPLQWLNLTSLTQGASPQALKDSSIGYDELTRSLIIFGGESQAGVPQQNTYLLNLDSLTWSTPSSKVASKVSSPPPRTQALGTGDFAANRFVLQSLFKLILCGI